MPFVFGLFFWVHLFGWKKIYKSPWDLPGGAPAWIPTSSFRSTWGQLLKWWYRFPNKTHGVFLLKNDQHLGGWKMGGNPPFKETNTHVFAFFSLGEMNFFSSCLFLVVQRDHHGQVVGPVFFFGQKKTKRCTLLRRHWHLWEYLGFLDDFSFGRLLATPFLLMRFESQKICYVEHMFSNYIFSTWRIIPVSRWFITMASFRPLSRLPHRIESEVSG